MTKLMGQLQQDASLLTDENDRLLQLTEDLRGKEERLLQIEAGPAGFGAADKAEYEDRLEILLRENELGQEQLSLMEAEMTKYNQRVGELEAQLADAQANAGLVPPLRAESAELMEQMKNAQELIQAHYNDCLLYTSDAADEEDSVDICGWRII
eukprot:TRINITY_DN34354_c0_g1_i2.p1 TRINITY_DN34354_c0_g1~~TRINITY_DN34354_c0_g1_i2.p1  ORF type:complete len:154 (+),score=46.36 TRINITY_DN34354_c0_g1_i2:26-487(+)